MNSSYLRMKKNIGAAFLFWGCVVAILFPFFVFPTVFQEFKDLSSSHPYIMAFVKFAILATMGEMMAMRIKSGSYYRKGFGLVPRAVIWGIFGVWIAFMMKIFYQGVPATIETFGIQGVVQAMSQNLSWLKLLGAFGVSLVMNTAFAPVFMTMHKITDMHIEENRGSVLSLIRPIPISKYIKTMDWERQWNFVFKKTIPFFWIPAHTMTFSLPKDMQVLSAALLSVALGLLLSFASKQKKES